MAASGSRTGRQMQRYNSKRQRLVVGCIPYRYKGCLSRCILSKEEIEVLIITTQSEGKGWLFPKGGWEEDETMKDAAKRETREEAGVTGDLQEELDQWTFKKNNGTSCEVHMFPLLVTKKVKSWSEEEIRKRKWVSVEEANRELCHDWMKKALKKLVDRIT